MKYHNFTAGNVNPTCPPPHKLFTARLYLWGRQNVTNTLLYKIFYLFFCVFEGCDLL